MEANRIQIQMTDWKIDKKPIDVGYSGENLVCEFEVLFPTDAGAYYYLQVDGWLETPNNILFTDVTENGIKVNLTTEMLGKGGKKKAQIVEYLSLRDNTPIKKSNIFNLIVEDSINATQDVEPHYQTALEQWTEELDEFWGEINEALAGKQDTLIAGENITIEGNVISAAGASVESYNDLTDKPSINSVTLSGNKTASDLALVPDSRTLGRLSLGANVSNYDFAGAVITSIVTDSGSQMSELIARLNDFYLAKTSTGASVAMSIDSSTYVLTLSLLNSSGTVLNTQTVDLPLESVVVGGSYDSTNKKIVLTLQNGNTIDVPVGDLINGLQSEITAQNKLASDLVDDTNQTNKFVTASEKSTWNAKSDFSGDYDDLTDKPSINSVTLAGNKTLGDLGAVPDTREVAGLPLSADISATSLSDKIATLAKTWQNLMTDNQGVSYLYASVYSKLQVDTLLNGKADKPLATVEETPTNCYANVGDVLTFEVVSYTTATLYYQWQQSTNGTTWSDISGATSTSYQYTVASGDDGKQFRCIISTGSAYNIAQGGFYKIKIAQYPVDDVQVNGSSVVSGGVASVTVPTKVSDLNNDSGFITKSVNDLTNYELKTNTGATIAMSLNSTTYVLTLSLKNSAGTVLNTETVDLPLESVVVNGTYDSTNKKIVLTLQSGSTIDIPVGDLINGLQSEITAQNKLASDLVDDSNQTNKFVTASEKNTWNAKSDFSGSYSDLSNKPSINSVTLSGNKTLADLSIQEKLVAGSNITIASDGKTISATDTTYSDATTQSAGLMSATDKSKLDGIASGAEVNVQADWNETDTTSDAYIQNKPTIPTVPVTDVQNSAGVSLVSQGVATVPLPTADQLVPSHSSSDSGKVLGVDAQGQTEWQNISVPSDNWELIDSKTLETAGQYYYTFTSQPYKLYKKLLFIITIPTVTTAIASNHLMLGVSTSNGMFVAGLASYTDTTAFNKTILDFSYLPDINNFNWYDNVLSESISMKSNNAYPEQAGNVTSRFLYSTYDWTRIRDGKVLYTRQSMPIGTKVYLYGIRR